MSVEIYVEEDIWKNMAIKKWDSGFGVGIRPRS